MTQFNPSRNTSHKASIANKDWSPSNGHEEAAHAKKETKKTDQISMKNLTTEEDLATLKKKDPFMYYSIPGVINASYLLEEVDLSNFAKSSIRRNCISCTSSLQTQEETLTRTVERRTCISFECHTDLIMSDLLDDDDDEDGDEEKKQEDGDDFEMVLSAMRRIS